MRLVNPPNATTVTFGHELNYMCTSASLRKAYRIIRSIKKLV
jgi:hypothetical protein